MTLETPNGPLDDFNYYRWTVRPSQRAIQMTTVPEQLSRTHESHSDKLWSQLQSACKYD